MTVVNNDELERLMLQVLRDPSYKTALIHALKISLVFVEARIEGDRTRFYDWERSDGSRIIDVYTSEKLLGKADGVNQQYCMRIPGMQLANGLQDYMISLNSPDCTVEFASGEFKLWTSPAVVSDCVQSQATAQVQLELLTAYPDKWVRPMAKLFHAFDSAQAAFLGLFAPTSEQHSNRLHLLVVVLVANTEDKTQMEAELLHQVMDMARVDGYDINFRLIDGTEATDDLALILTQKVQPFYIRSKNNQWRRKLGLAPTVSVKTL